MSRNGDIRIEWADGEHEFRLAIGQIRELQEKCGNEGPMRIFLALAGQDWRVEHVRETLRLGLIGGGLAPAKALALVKRYVDERPLAENVQAAMAVLGAALFGSDEEELDAGKPQAGAKNGTGDPS